MHAPPPLILAALADLIVPLIGVAILVISWLYNLGKKVQEEQARRERQRRIEEARMRGAIPGAGGATGVSGASGVSGGSEVEALAELRRQQMEAGPDPEPIFLNTQPNNLTLEEMRERATARIEYERRAASLRQAGPVSEDPREAIEQARRQQEQALRRRQAKAARQRAAQSRAGSAGSPGSMAPRTPSYRPPPPPPISVQHAQTPQAFELAEHQHSAEVERPAGPARRATVRLSGGPATLNVRSLRDAIVLKEVLDPPLALRPAGGQQPG